MLRAALNRLEENLSKDMSLKFDKQAENNSRKITDEITNKITKLTKEKYDEMGKYVKDVSTAPIKKGLISGLIGGVLGSILIGAGIYYVANNTIADKTESYENRIKASEDNFKNGNQRINTLESRVYGVVQANKRTAPATPNISNTLNVPKENIEYKITISAVSADGTDLQSNCTQTYGQIVKWYDMENQDKIEFSDQESISVLTSNILKNTSLMEKVKLLGGDPQADYDKDVINAYFNDDKKDGKITKIQIEKK
jgi:hypothetical protein